jgi:hypothetical protein
MRTPRAQCSHRKRSTDPPSRRPKESNMNREFNVTSKFVRSILAAAAALCTVIVVGSIDSLAQHYSAELQAAASPSILIVRR